MRRSRWLAFGLVALAFPVLAMPFLYAQSGAPRSSQLEAVVTQLDAVGNVVSSNKTGLLRVYADGSFSVNDGDQTYSGSANGSKDFQLSKALQLQDGLIKTPAGLRALPLGVKTTYKLDGGEVNPDQIAGKSGDVEVDITVTNRTLQTQEVTYTDSNTGKQVTRVGDVAIPLQVALSGINLPDANFDSVDSNGVLTRSSDNKSTDVVWSALLAPPLFQGSQTFVLKGKTKNFRMTAPRIATQLTSAATLPPSIKGLIDKAGGDTATIKGYFGTFGSGFGAVQSGAGLMKAGEDALLDGLNNTKFDKTAYAEDSQIKTNQPGVLEGLHLIDDGLGSANAFDCTGDGKADPYGAKCNEGTAGAKPLGLMAGLHAVRSGLSSGDLSKPKIIEGLKLVLAGIGDESNAKSLLGGLAAIRSGISSGDATKPKLLEGLQLILAGIGKGSEYDCNGDGLPDAGCTVASTGAAPVGVRAGLNLVRHGLDTLTGFLGLIRTGVGTGSEFGVHATTVDFGGNSTDGAALPTAYLSVDSLQAGTKAVRGGIGDATTPEFDCSIPPDGHPEAKVPAPSANAPAGGLFPGVVAGTTACQAGQPVYLIGGTTLVSASPTTIHASLESVKAALTLTTLNQVLAANGQAPIGGIPGLVVSGFFSTLNTGIGTNDNATTASYDCPPYVQTGTAFAHVADPNSTCDAHTAGAKPLSLEAGLQQIYNGAGNATTPEFDCTGDGVADPYVVPTCFEGTPGAKPLTTAAALKQIYAGIGAGTEFAGKTPLTIQAGIAAIKIGIGDGSEFDTSGATPKPLTIQAGLVAIEAGLSSGDPNNPAIIEGLNLILAGLGDKATAASLIGGLTAVKAGLSSGSATNPAILEGLQIIQAGIGDFNADGTATKAVTTRISKAGHTIETPLTIGYGLQAIRDGLTKFFTGFGDRKVKGLTVLSGLTQISDGLQQVIDGTKTGVSGADTLQNVVEKTVNTQDINVALYQAGVQRAKDYKAFVSAPSDASSKVLFLFNLPAIG
jgi:hypothetical protein